MPKYGPNYLSRSNVGDDSTSSSIVAVGADFRNHCGGCLPSSAFPWRLSSHPSPPKYSYGAYMEHCKLPKSQACPEAGVWPPTLLETLASSLTNILLSLTKLLLSPKLVTITFVNFDSSTACTIATSIVQSKLDYCNSLYNKLPKSQLPVSNRSRTLLLILSLKFPSPVILPPYYSLHWLRITESIEYMLLSLTHKVLTTTQPPVHTCLHFQFTHSFIQHFFLLIHHYTHPQIPLFHSRLKTYLFHKSCPP